MKKFIEIGPWIVGETPEPLNYTFLNANNELIPLTGYTGVFQFRTSAGVTERAATLIGSTATFTWTGTDLATPGVHEGVFWVGNGTHRFASIPFIYRVNPGPGTAPTI